GLRREIWRDDREEAGEAVLVIRQRADERLPRMSRFGADDEVDVRHLVPVADQGFTDIEFRCHGTHLRTNVDVERTRDRVEEIISEPRTSPLDAMRRVG